MLADGRTVAEGTPIELKDRVGDRRVDLVVPDGDSPAALSALVAAGLDTELGERDAPSRSARHTATPTSSTC